MTRNGRAVKAVCDFYGIHVRRLIEGGKVPHLADARAVAMWLLRAWAGRSYPETARAVGLKNHTSAMAGVRKVDKREDLREAAKAIAAWLDERGEQRRAA